MQYQEGELYVAGSSSAYIRDKCFVLIVGRTAGGSLKVQRVPKRIVQSNSTPAQSCDIVTPDLEAFQKHPPPVEIARYSKKNQGYQIKQNEDFHFVIRNLIRPGESITIERYF